MVLVLLPRKAEISGSQRCFHCRCNQHKFVQPSDANLFQLRFQRKRACGMVEMTRCQNMSLCASHWQSLNKSRCSQHIFSFSFRMVFRIFVSRWKRDQGGLLWNLNRIIKIFSGWNRYLDINRQISLYPPYISAASIQCSFNSQKM